MSRGEKGALAVVICGGVPFLTGFILTMYLLWRGLTTHEWLDEGFLFIQIRAIILAGVGYFVVMTGCLLGKSASRKERTR